VGDDISVDEGSGSGLVIHAVVFAAVNVMLIALWALATTGASFEAVPDLLANPGRAREAGFFPIYVIITWGAALVIHAGVFVAGIPRRRRRRRARRRQRRRLQRTVVGALGDTVLADAALAGIEMVEGERAARQVERDAHRHRSKKGKPSNGRPSNGKPSNGRASNGRPSRGKPPSGKPPKAATRSPKAKKATLAPSRSNDRRDGRHWVAVMFTDIVDSTPLNQRMGDDAWAEVIAAHRAMVRSCVDEHHGSEVGTQGDGFLVRFDDPDDAARCAIALQRLLLDARADDARAVHVRIGIHAGEVVQNDDDLVGRVINLASRVTSAAAADEILVTEPLADHLSGGHPLVDRGLKTLKGFDQPRHLLALAWHDAHEIVLDDQAHEPNQPNQPNL